MVIKQVAFSVKSHNICQYSLKCKPNFSKHVKCGATNCCKRSKEIKQSRYRPGVAQRAPDKAVPLQAWSGPEGSRNLRFPDFMTTAEDGVKVVNLTHRPPLPPGHTPGTHFC